MPGISKGNVRLDLCVPHTNHKSHLGCSLLPKVTESLLKPKCPVATPVNTFSLVLLRFMRYLDIFVTTRIQFFDWLQPIWLFQNITKVFFSSFLISLPIIDFGIPSIGSGPVNLVVAANLASSSVFSLLSMPE